MKVSGFVCEFFKEDVKEHICLCRLEKMKKLQPVKDGYITGVS